MGIIIRVHCDGCFNQWETGNISLPTIDQSSCQLSHLILFKPKKQRNKSEKNPQIHVQEQTIKNKNKKEKNKQTNNKTKQEAQGP